MTRFILVILYIATAISCTSKTDVVNSKVEIKTKEEPSKYPRMVGDIAFDPTLDNPDFEICNENNVKQYFNFVKGAVYIDEKSSFIDLVEKEYKPITTDQSGLLRIRFIVNCKGKSGRYRTLMMNEEYKSIEFSDQIVNQLLTIIKQQASWPLLPDQSNPEDYYQYLTFKLKKGQITEILP